MFTKINATQPQCFGNGGMQAISLDERKRHAAAANVKREVDEGFGACSQETLLGPRPLERKKRPFRTWVNVAVIIYHCIWKQHVSL